MKSLPFFPCKVKFEDPLPKINEKHDTFNGKYRQYGAVLNHQETTNGHFVQSITKKKKIDNTYSSDASECLSGRHPGELEVERQRKLTRGKAVEDQLVCPKFEEIQRDNLPRYKAGKEHVVKATIKKKSKSSKYRKINNNTDFQDQCMVERALESYAAENSCSSVSSNESFMARIHPSQNSDHQIHPSQELHRIPHSKMHLSQMLQFSALETVYRPGGSLQEPAIQCCNFQNEEACKGV